VCRVNSQPVASQFEYAYLNPAFLGSRFLELEHELIQTQMAQKLMMRS
jgi:hypothetical protein